MPHQVRLQRLSFEEYLDYDDGTDNRYELVDGELVEMPPENPLNCLFAKFLFVEFLKFFPLAQVCMKDAEVEVSGWRVRTRYPDVMVLSDELVEALRGANRNTITREMPPPLLVVEVVSPGKENEDRDYRYKRSEYAVRGIAEYWIVDSQRQQVTVLILMDGFYEESVFTGEQSIVSEIISKLNLTPAQIFAT